MADYARQYNIFITNWQHEDYTLDEDFRLCRDQDCLVEFIKDNLCNWGLVTNQDGSVSVYLLPIGVTTELYTSNINHGDLEQQTRNRLQALSRKPTQLKPTDDNAILKLKAVVELADAAREEQSNNIFYDRRAMMEGTEIDAYSFSVIFDEKTGKYMPYRKNGQVMPTQSMEGFVCFDTAYKYIADHADDFTHMESDGWTYLVLEKQSSSYMAIRSSDEGLELVGVSATPEKKYLEYRIKEVDGGLHCTAFVSTKEGVLVLTDIATYFREEQ